MSLQNVINYSNGLKINRRKVVGIQYTRNEIPRTTLIPTLNPWRFTIDLPTSLRYSEARNMIEDLDSLDRIYSEVITFNNNPNMNWIFRYQGSMTTVQVNAITVDSFIGNELTLTNLPIVNANRVLFEKNDLIQIGDTPYTYTSTQQVLRGSDPTVTLTTHRPCINPVSAFLSTIKVGSGCQFKMFCPNMPTYKLYPGGTIYQNNQMINNAYIEWSGEFELRESVGTIL